MRGFGSKSKKGGGNKGQSFEDSCEKLMKQYTASKPAAKWYGQDKVFDVVIPAEEFKASFARSAGPGGQHVNKVNTKADVRVQVLEAKWIPNEVKEKLKEIHGGSINKQGELYTSSMTHKVQGLNLKECYTKLQDMVNDGCMVPREKKYTEVPKHAIEKRLQWKKKRTERNRNRQEKLNH